MWNKTMKILPFTPRCGVITWSKGSIFIVLCIQTQSAFIIMQKMSNSNAW